MKLFKNSVGSLVALVDSEDIVDISNYATSATTTTLTIPAVNNKDINFVNYGGVAWTLAPDLNEGLTINKSTSGITVNAGKSVSLRYDSLAKNFIIAGSSESSGGGGAVSSVNGQTGAVIVQAPLVAGTNITIDNTNPSAPVISASGGGGGSFNPNTDQIGGTITPLNTPIIANMTVNDAFEATQGQINSISSTNDTITYTTNQTSYAVDQGSKYWRNHIINTNQATVTLTLSNFLDGSNGKILLTNNNASMAVTIAGPLATSIDMFVDGTLQPDATVSAVLIGTVTSTYRIDIERFSSTKYIIYFVKTRV